MYPRFEIPVLNHNFQMYFGIKHDTDLLKNAEPSHLNLIIKLTMSLSEDYYSSWFIR